MIKNNSGREQMSLQLKLFIENFCQNIVGLNVIPTTLTSAKHHFATFEDSDYILISLGALVAFLTSYLIGAVIINIMQHKLDDATTKLFNKAKDYANGYFIYLLLLSSIPLGCVLPIIAGILRTPPLKTTILLICASLIGLAKYL
jgi:membrane protein YqaA with SNARE-associated domain